MEIKSSGKDTTFQKEVQDCLKEQLTFISELQTEMFKELDNSKKNVKEIIWQMAKLESDLENNLDVRKSQETATKNKQLSHAKTEGVDKSLESTLGTSHN